MNSLETAMHRIDDLKQVEHRTELNRARTRRRQRVIKHLDGKTYWQLMSWLSEGRKDGIRFLSLDEAVRFLSVQVQRANNAIACGHWSSSDWSNRLPGLRDRLIVARYFAKHGAELWAQEAA